MKKLFALAAALVFVCGCGGTVRSLYSTGTTMAKGALVYTDQQCKTLHNEEIGLTTAAAVVAALSGSTGISAAFVDPDDQRKALGITSVVAAVLTAGIGTWLHFVHEDFSTGCIIAPNNTSSGVSTQPASNKTTVPTTQPSPSTSKSLPVQPKPSILNQKLLCPNCDWYTPQKPEPQ